MRADNQFKSLHYFRTYGVRDRIDLSMFRNETKIPDVSSIFNPRYINTPLTNQNVMKGVFSCDNVGSVRNTNSLVD